MLGCQWLSQLKSKWGQDRQSTAHGCTECAHRCTRTLGPWSRQLKATGKSQSSKRTALRTKRKTGQTWSSRTLVCDVKLTLSTVSKRLQEQFTECSSLYWYLSHKTWRWKPTIDAHKLPKHPYFNICSYVFLRSLPNSLPGFFPWP